MPAHRFCRSHPPHDSSESQPRAATLAPPIGLLPHTQTDAYSIRQRCKLLIPLTLSLFPFALNSLNM